MNDSILTIMGATGNTGGHIARALLAAGKRVRVIGRNPDKLAELAALGAEIRCGDVEDPAFLTAAFTGSRAVYTLLPTDRTAPDYRAAQDRQGEAIVAAVRASGVRHVVALSSLGADRSDAPGVIGGLAVHEQRLRGLDAAVLLLRPVSFFENYYDMLPIVRHAGIVADGLAADLAQPMIAARDIASIATAALLDPTWSGVTVRELVGPRDLSPREMTAILGARLGRPELPYIELGGDALVGALVEAGLSRSFAEQYRAMAEVMSTGALTPRHRGPAMIMPTRFEDFADELAIAYAGAA